MLDLIVAGLLAVAPIKVVVIDTGLDLKDERFKQVLCLTGHDNFTNESMTDYAGHGTHVAGLIKQYAGLSNYCLIILKYYSTRDPENNTRRAQQAIRRAVELGASVINFSAGGPGSNPEECMLLTLHPEVTVVVAAGNDGANLDRNCDYYPACYNLPNVRVVGAIGIDRQRYASSNYGAVVKNVEPGERIVSTLPHNQYGPMSGTSMAAAIHTGKLISGRR